MSSAVSTPAETFLQPKSLTLNARTSSNAASSPLNAESGGLSDDEMSATAITKLFRFSAAICFHFNSGNDYYAAVRLAWKECKMDGYVMPQDEIQKQPRRRFQKITDAETASMGESSNGMALRKRSIKDYAEKESDDASLPKRTKHDGPVNTEIDEIQDKSDKEEDEENEGSGDTLSAEEMQQAKKLKEYEHHRQHAIDSDLIKLTHGATKQRDVEWALDAILRFASIAPGEPAAILRHVIATLPGNADLYRHGGDIGPVKNELQELVDAGNFWLDDFNQDPTQAFIRAFNIAIAFRVVTRKHHQKGKQDIEERANELLKLRNLKHAHTLGVKVLTIAFAISPRNMIGVLLLPHFGLDVSALQDLSTGKMVALVGLLTSNHWTLEQMGITKEHGDLIDFISNRLIPGIEAVMMANLYKGTELHPSLSTLIHYDVYEDGDWGFGLKISKRTPGSNSESIIRMPPLFLIDSSFKTAKVDKYEIQYIVNLCRNRVHLDRQILSSKISPPGPITADVFEAWLQYQKFWKIRTPSKLTRPYDKIVPRCGNKGPISQEEWDEQNRYITFWGTLLCKCPVHRRMLRENFNPLVLGVLSKEELTKYQHHDAQSVARYDIKKIMRESSPEPED